jgi:spore coat protein H
VNTLKKATNRITSLQCAFSALIFTATLGVAFAETGPLPTKSEQLFQTTKVWTVHLTLSSDQWAAMEPKGEHGAASEGPGRGPAEPGGFGPAMFVVPSFLRGDQDRDGKLSKPEFEALSEKWFQDWDKEKSDKLNGDQLRAGLNTLMAAPEGGPIRFGKLPGNLRVSDGSGRERDARRGAQRLMGFGLDFPEVHADLDFNGQQFKDVAVRYKGNFTYMASRSQLKRSLKIDLNEYVKGQKLAGVSTLNLHSNVTDPGWMNEVLSYRLYRDAGVPAPRTAYARVFVTVPGKYDQYYVGLYSLVENIQTISPENVSGRRRERSSNRIHSIFSGTSAAIGRTMLGLTIRKETFRTRTSSAWLNSPAS